MPDTLPRVCVAQIGAAHGIRGEVRLKSFTEVPGDVARYGLLQTEDGRREIEIASLRPAKDLFVARLKGVDDRNAAEALRNVRLYVPRDRLGAAAEDEFFHADLIGLAAEGRNGNKLGTVASVQNFGAGDLIEITPADGGPSFFLSFTRAIVPEVDIAGGRVVIDLPSEVEE